VNTPLAVEERDLCFALEGSPPGSGRSLPSPDGRIRLLHELEGTVVSVSATHIDLGSAVGLVRVRFVLPRGVGLAPLLGHRIKLEALHVIGARTCFHLRLRDEHGALLLWAFDGLLPGGDDALRAVWDAEGEQLALVPAGGVAVPAPRDFGAIELGGVTFRFVALRASQPEAAFVLAR
jgi:hypothetical protein